MAAQCRPHSYGRTCCCTRGHTSPVNGKRHTFHRRHGPILPHGRQHITTITPTRPPPPRPQRQHVTTTSAELPNTATFRGHADTIRPHTKNASGHVPTSTRPPPLRPHRQRPSLPPTRPKKSPHTGFSPVGAISLFSYKFHDFFGGFSVRGFYELCF